ncbi:Hypothetical predicted protein [Mytilus galloprovincialis]|uniref:Ankyrin repeat protein n=1 Tax=Mytilus galloprovincialis TaxID=29158 RepID=A0A8B6F3C7_MYTGA|nr:Hypothetical predicted protein [Mytilus galloprovincialis]
MRACETGNIAIVKCVLDKVDHNLIDFKAVIRKLYEYCNNHKNERSLRIFKVIVENVDWKQLDMKKVMNLACTLNSLYTVECILEKVDHKLLDMKIAMSEASEAGNTDIVKYILDKLDHNLIDFKDVIRKLYEYCNNHRNESISLVLKVLVENVDWKQLDMKTVMNLACTLNSLYTVECILEKVDHKLLDMKSGMIQACKTGNTDIVEFILDKVDHKLLNMKRVMIRACEAGNTDIVKCVLDKVDHHLIEFKDVISNLYEYCSNHRNKSSFLVLQVLVENVDWKQLDMKTVLNLVCKLNSLYTVECILYKVDHKLLDINSAIIQACEAGNTDIVKCILVRVDHNLIEFMDVLNEFYGYCKNYNYERLLLILKVIVEM